MCVRACRYITQNTAPTSGLARELHRFKSGLEKKKEEMKLLSADLSHVNGVLIASRCV